MNIITNNCFLTSFNLTFFLFLEILDMCSFSATCLLMYVATNEYRTKNTCHAEHRELKNPAFSNSIEAASQLPHQTCSRSAIAPSWFQKPENCKAHDLILDDQLAHDEVHIAQDLDDILHHIVGLHRNQRPLQVQVEDLVLSQSHVLRLAVVIVSREVHTLHCLQVRSLAVHLIADAATSADACPHVIGLIFLHGSTSTLTYFWVIYLVLVELNLVDIHHSAGRAMVPGHLNFIEFHTVLGVQSLQSKVHIALSILIVQSATNCQ